MLNYLNSIVVFLKAILSKCILLVFGFVFVNILSIVVITYYISTIDKSSDLYYELYPKIVYVWDLLIILAIINITVVSLDTLFDILQELIKRKVKNA